MATRTAPRVELLWWEGCPSTDHALGELRRAMDSLGLDPEAVEMRRIDSDEDAEHEGFPGSPTIRVDGRDVQPDPTAPVGLSCRIYRLRDGSPSPNPDPADLRAALAAAAVAGG